MPFKVIQGQLQNCFDETHWGLRYILRHNNFSLIHELYKDLATARNKFLNSWKFPGLPGFAHGYFSKKIYGLLFQWYRLKVCWWVPVGPHTYYSSISTRLPEILDCSFQWGLWTPNFGKGEAVGGRGWYHSKERWRVLTPPYILFLYQHSFARNFRLQFSVGVANPDFGERGVRRGSRMVPFERALVSFYRPSIVNFPLYLRVSEILPLLFSRTPLFPYPTSSLPKISPCFPGSRWIAFWLQRAKVWG